MSTPTVTLWPTRMPNRLRSLPPLPPAAASTPNITAVPTPTNPTMPVPADVAASSTILIAECGPRASHARQVAALASQHLTFAGESSACRIVTLGNSQDEHYAWQCDVQAQDRINTRADAAKLIAALSPAQLWLAGGDGKLAAGLGNVLTRNLTRTSGRPIVPPVCREIVTTYRGHRLALDCNAPVCLPPQFGPVVQLDLADAAHHWATLRARPEFASQRARSRAAMGLSDGDTALGLVCAPHERHIALFSRVIGMLALGGHEVIGLADGQCHEADHAAVSAALVDDQFEIIMLDGPAEAALDGLDAVVWLGADGELAALKAACMGLPVVTVNSPAARLLASIATDLLDDSLTLRTNRAGVRAGESSFSPAAADSAPIDGPITLAPSATMASIGARVMSALRLIDASEIAR